VGFFGVFVGLQGDYLGISPTRFKRNSPRLQRTQMTKTEIVFDEFSKLRILEPQGFDNSQLLKEHCNDFISSSLISRRNPRIQCNDFILLFNFGTETEPS
jgi:hypothetical protein